MTLTVEDPFECFKTWLHEASQSEPNDPNAMALATVHQDGMPDVRMVLLKDFDRTGFVFYTNLHSQKGQDLSHNPKAALCFHWKSLQRQVRIHGTVSPVSTTEADAYFASRGREKCIGAWASKQSQPIPDKFAFEKRLAQFALKFGLGSVPRPEFWSGYRLKPLQIEFWKAHPFRLHERLQCTLQTNGEWTQTPLYP